MEALQSVRVEEAWPQLVRLRPELGALEGQFAPGSIRQGDEDAGWDQLFTALAPLIGPDADTGVTDRVLRSVTAHDIARLFLAVRVGLLDRVEYE
jgi:hypothetical protein